MKKIFFLFLFLFAAGFYYYKFSFPIELRKIPYAEDQGLLLDLKDVEIAEVPYPLNSSIVEYEDGYLMTFRFFLGEDVKVGIVELDQNFQQKQSPEIIHTEYGAEDARLFAHEGEYFIVYNAISEHEPSYRVMHLGHLQKNSWEMDYSTLFDLHIQRIEKNWVPFSLQNKIFLSYGLYPHKVMEVIDVKETNGLQQLCFPHNPPAQRLHWKWGSLRGGTPARFLDGEYIAFFHSRFGFNNGLKSRNHWYVMGAYTFESTPPYRITRISKHPILFREFSDAQILYPTGLAITEWKGKEALVVSFGKNDMYSKIAIFDKQKLLQSLRPVH